MKWMSFDGDGIRRTTVDAKLGEFLLQEIENASFIAELKDRYHTIKYFRILLHIRLNGNKSFEYKFGIHTLKTICN